LHLHPLISSVRRLTRARKGVHHVLFNILYAVRYFIIIRDLNNVGQPSNRRRGRVSGDLSGELFR
jgi:hypothetical protein